MFQSMYIYQMLKVNGNLEKVISTFEGISLEEMKRVKLMNRVDTKYVLHESILIDVLQDVLGDYQALTFDDQRGMLYETDYYDTEDFKFYLHHHNGRINRKKVRTRKYCESDICFLEVKVKDNKGKTKKTRVKKETMDLSFSENEKKFLENSPVATYKGFLHSLKVNYRRLTLAHKTKCERITIDFDLMSYRPKNKSSENENTPDVFDMKSLVIIEVKQEKYNRDSEIMQSLRKNGIREMRMSKYCMGCAALYPQLKHNRFKEKLLYINRLKQLDALAS